MTASIDWGHPGFSFVNVVEAFQGIDPTGAADSGPGMATAWAALNGTSQAPYLPPGTYQVTTAAPPAAGQIVYCGNPGSVAFTGANANSVAAVATVYQQLVSIRPIDGTSDDAPRVQAALAAQALVGGAVRLLPGLSGQMWNFLTPCDLSSIYGAHLIGHPKAFGTFNIATNGVLGSPIVANVTQQAGQVTGTLTADVVIGVTGLTGNPLQITIGGGGTPPVKGGAVMLYFGTYDASIYDIIATPVHVSGNNYTVLLDRPVMRPYTAAGSTVRLLTSYPKNIHLEMEGMTWSGVGDRGVELLGCLHGTVTDMFWNDSIGVTRNGGVIAMDIGSRQAKVERCEVDIATATGIGCFSFETVENGVIEDCVGKNSPYAGIYNMDGLGNEFRGNCFYNTTVGIALIANADASGLGPYNTKIIGNKAYACSTVGGRVDLGESAMLAENSFTYCGNGFVANGGNGLAVDDLDVSGSTGYALQIAASMNASRIRAYYLPHNTNSSSGHLQFSSGTITIRGLDVSIPASSSDFALAITNTCTLILHDTNIALADSGSYGMYQQAGTARIHNYSVTGTYGKGWRADAGTLFVGPNFNVTGSQGALFDGATVTVQQDAGPPLAANATAALIVPQMQTTAIESSGNSSGTVAITAATFNVVPGMQWACRNNNTSTSTTTFFGVTVAVGRSAIIRINSAGAGERVTADT